MPASSDLRGQALLSNQGTCSQEDMTALKSKPEAVAEL